MKMKDNEQLQYENEQLAQGNNKLWTQLEKSAEILSHHEAYITMLEETNEALKAELKEVCDVLIRKCPEMKEWVMMNWKHLYEVLK
jgi:hypothetical protein